MSTFMIRPFMLLPLPALADRLRRCGCGPRPAGRQPLFDGKSLEGWKVTDFGGEGEVKVEEARSS